MNKLGYIGHVDKLIMISYLYSYVKTILKSYDKNYGDNFCFAQNVIYKSYAHNFATFLEIVLISYVSQNVIHKSYEYNLSLVP
jgi:hypothetical protein